MILFEGEISVNGGAYTSLFSRQGDTRYPVDLSAYPNGTALKIRVRARDTTDDAVSLWSAERTINVTRAAPVSVSTLSAFDYTRGMTAAERAVLLSSEHYDVYTQVLIQDEDGDWRDVAALGGENFFKSFEITRQQDQSIYSFSVELKREVQRTDGTTVSLAPTVTASEINTDNVGAFSPLLRRGAAIRVFTATQAADGALGSLILEADGFMDDPDWGSSSVKVSARSRSGKNLADAPILDPKQYGSDAGTPLADVIRQHVADAGSADPLVVVGSIDWFVRKYDQTPGASRLEAIRTAALQNGSTVQDRFSSRSTAQLALYHPPRSSSVGAPHLTLVPGEYETLDQFMTKGDDVRNFVRLHYVDRATGKMGTVEVRDQASIDTHGFRPMQLALAATSNVDTLAEGQAMANYALLDLAQPYLVIKVRLPYFWGVDLGAIVELPANGVHHDSPQRGVVWEIRHEINEGARNTYLTLHGRVRGAHQAWLNRQAPVVTNLPLVVDALAEVIDTDDTSYYVRLSGVAKRGDIDTGVIPQVALMTLFGGATLLEGPTLETFVPSGTVWRISRPEGEVPGSFVHRARLVTGEFDEGRDIILQQGVAVDPDTPQLRWSSFDLVEAESDKTKSRYTGTLSLVSGTLDPATIATAVLTRTGPGAAVVPVGPLTGTLPLTVAFDAPRQGFQSGESLVEAYGSAPGAYGDWERVSVAAVERDTVALEIDVSVELRGGASQRVTLKARAPVGTIPPSDIFMDESLGTTVTQFGLDTVTGAVRERVYDMTRPQDGNGDGAALFRAVLAGFVDRTATVKVPEQLPATVAPPILPIPASIFTQWQNDTTGRLIISFGDPDGRYVANSFQYRIQNSDGTWPASFIAMTTSVSGNARTAYVDVAVPAGKTVNVEWKYQYIDADGGTATVSSVQPFTSKLADPGYASTGGSTFTGAVSAPQFTVPGVLDLYAPTTYASARIDGAQNGYAGIQFGSVGRYLMVGANLQGIFDGTNWQWYFENKALKEGTVGIDRLTAGTKDFGPASVKYMFDATNGSQFLAEKPNTGTMPTLHAPFNSYSPTSRPVGYGFYIAAVIAGTLQLRPDGKFHFRNEADTAHAPLEVSVLYAEQVQATGDVYARGQRIGQDYYGSGTPETVVSNPQIGDKYWRVL